MSGFGAKNIWDKLNNLALVRFLLLVASGWAIVQLLAYFWAIVQLLAYFEAVIVIFTFATILAFLLSYPVQWLQRYLPRSIAVIVVFLTSVIMIGSLIITVGLGVLSQGQQLIDSISTFLSSLAPLLEQLEQVFQKRNLQIDLSVIEEQLRNAA